MHPISPSFWILNQWRSNTRESKITQMAFLPRRWFEDLVGIWVPEKQFSSHWDESTHWSQDKWPRDITGPLSEWRRVGTREQAEVLSTVGGHQALTLFSRGRLERSAGMGPPVTFPREVRGLCCESLSRVWLFATPWTVAHQAPLSTGILQAGILVGCHALFQGIFPTQKLNSGLLHGRQILYHLSH